MIPSVAECEGATKPRGKKKNKKLIKVATSTWP
jgi:hypothetical protein